MISKPTYEELEARIKALEMELKQVKNESSLNSLYRQIPTMLHSIDDQGVITNVSMAWLETLGYSMDEVVGRKSSDFLTEESKKYANEVVLPDFFKKGYCNEIPYDFVTKKGEIVSVLLSAISERNEAGSVIRSYAVLNNVTQLKNTENKLRKQNEELSQAIRKAESAAELLRNITDNIPAYIAVVDANELRYRFVNSKFPVGFNMTYDQIVGAHIVEVIGKPNADFAMKHIEEVRRGNNSSYVNTFNLAEGVRHINVNYVPGFNEKGEVQDIIVLSHDVTPIKESERELREAKEKAEESNMLKTEFINNMSHEIRTPMNGILGFSQLLSEEGVTNEMRDNYITIIQNSADQLMRIIDDILEISRLGTRQVVLQNSEYCLNDILLELFTIFDVKAKENRTPMYLNKGLSDRESTIFTDKTALNKILSNLLENALKFTSEGSIEFGYFVEEGQLKIFVKDTGVGIHKDKHEVIFERFAQEEKNLSRKLGGLGLGLSIARENAELLGGSISLESEKGKGATFVVSLPYNPVYSIMGSSDVEPASVSDPKDKFSVLIVEDEEVNYLYIETLMNALVERNRKIYHAKNGLEAIEKCREHPEIDFILMDIKLPVMNGFEAALKIKEANPAVHIVAQTAYTAGEYVDRAKQAGCDDFISKPIRKKDLKEVYDKYLAKAKVV